MIIGSKISKNTLQRPNIHRFLRVHAYFLEKPIVRVLESKRTTSPSKSFSLPGNEITFCSQYDNELHGGPYVPRCQAVYRCKTIQLRQKLVQFTCPGHAPTATPRCNLFLLSTPAIFPSTRESDFSIHRERKPIPR